LNTETPSPTVKEEARQGILAKLRETTAEQRSAWSSAIVRWLTLSDAWIGHGGTVALFGGMKLEADLLSVIPWLRTQGLRAAFLAIEPNRTLTPYLVHREEDLVPGVFGVLEPRRDPEMRLNIEDIGTVLVPGRAFSPVDGTRLGLGKGHYDRFLAAPGMRARKVGVSFAMQMMDSVPSEVHDVKMDALLSESGWSGIGTNRRANPWATSDLDEVPAEELGKYLLALFTED
jgi:5-formyltetrahydrofolate cyclo-ligase